MKVFLSYARENRARVDVIAKGLELLGVDAFVDEKLTGAQPWWDVILTRIRDCQVFVVIVSKPGLDSVACHRERDYAHRLGKPLLPILVEAVNMQLLPAELATLEIIDYTDPDDVFVGFRVARAIDDLHDAPPLPDPLPEPPEVPLSYLGKLGEQLMVPVGELCLDDQLVLVTKLRGALDVEDDRPAALELLERLKARDDLFAKASKEVEAILAQTSAQSSVAAQAEPSPAEVASAEVASAEASLADAPVLAPPAVVSSGSPLEPLVTIDQAPVEAERLCVHPDNRRVVTGWADNTARVWDLTTGELVQTFGAHENVVNAVAVTPDGRQLVTGAGDQKVRIWDLDTGVLVRTLANWGSKSHWGPVYSLALTPAGDRIVSGSKDGDIRVWTNDAHQRTIAGSKEVWSLAVTPDGANVAAAIETGSVKVHALASGSLIWELNGHGGRATAVAVSPDGTKFVSGSIDDTVRVWSAVNGAPMNTLAVGGGGVFTVFLVADSTQAVVGCGDGTIRVLELATGRQTRVVEAHEKLIFGLDGTRDGQRLVTSALEGTVKVWDLPALLAGP